MIKTNETDSKTVLTERGKELRFNDHVYCELCACSEEKRSGRLVQVRKGCGQFGSNQYFVRLRDGSLMTWENVMIRHVDDEDFVNAFYISNGMKPPVILPQDVDEVDSITTEYKINHKYPEIGFNIEKPIQPETPGCFSMVISHG